MCLLSTEKRLKRAKEDIVCYKYLSWDYVHNCLITPVRLTKIKNEKVINGLKPYRAKGLVQKEKSPSDHYYYEGGLIHAYTKIPKKYSTINIMFKCHIPKGTRYVESPCYEEIAAKKIVFDELIHCPEIYNDVKELITYIEKTSN